MILGHFEVEEDESTQIKVEDHTGTPVSTKLLPKLTAALVGMDTYNDE